MGIKLDRRTVDGLIVLAFLAAMMLIACAAITLSLHMLGVGP